jgi:hypothetical protein
VTLDLSQRQQQAGYANTLALLSAEQTYQQALINRVQAQANRYADTAALFQALGGGWWNRADLATAQHGQSVAATGSRCGTCGESRGRAGGCRAGGGCDGIRRLLIQD